MDNVVYRMIASLFASGIFCLCSWKLLGVMQQSGYKNRIFSQWLKKKENLYYNRLCVFALCIALSTTVVSLCFSFLGTRWALLISSLPFMACCVAFCYADDKFALKIPVKSTGRLLRLLATYALFLACVCYFWIGSLVVLAKWNGSQLYALIAFAPFAVLPLLLPFLLSAANGVNSLFENERNAGFIKRAGVELDKKEIVRVGIVGSYGKTSVKNILKTILSEKYTVVSTPESYNTPIGVAKTVYSPDFADKQVFIAEMGARRVGDIAQLRDMVKPDYAIFTGVCEQHLATFETLENIWQAKKEIFFGKAKVVCGESLQEWVQSDNSIAVDSVVFANAVQVKDVVLQAKETKFTLCVGKEEFSLSTKLLGNAAVENICLAAMLAYEMGLSAAEIVSGIKKIDYIPHRLQLIENKGVYILDDSYNCNPKGAKESLAALSRFEGRKCVITPGIVECGVMEEEKNGELGEDIANGRFDKVILVGDTLVGSVKSGYEKAQGDMEALTTVKTLEEAKTLLADWVKRGDAVLFLNDLPDVY